VKVVPPPKDKLTIHLEKMGGENEDHQGTLLKLAAQFKDEKKFSLEVMLEFMGAYGEEKSVENIDAEVQVREDPVRK